MRNIFRKRIFAGIILSLFVSLSTLPAQKAESPAVSESGIRLYVMPLQLLSVEPRLRTGIEFRLTPDFYLNLSTDLHFYDPSESYDFLSRYRYYFFEAEFKHYYGKRRKAYWSFSGFIRHRRAIRTREEWFMNPGTGIIRTVHQYDVDNYRAGLALSTGRVIELGKRFYLDLYAGMGPVYYRYRYTLTNDELAPPLYAPYYLDYPYGGCLFTVVRRNFWGHLLVPANENGIGMYVRAGLRIGIKGL
ncbi:MAG: DUF3575 domain-containing protein [Chlorobi bacterium]|nr:DUF3575 domain-containing protein [Chlorobiota bacterium]